MTKTTGHHWRKSTRSMGNGGNCVEVASADHHLYVQDSKNPHGVMLKFNADQWRTFIQTIKNDRLGPN
ncbi:DUF397 domain-containing protein [Thermomonospora amylolytica]|uniref:DUF397 domain-containing protein n=1 Tax=Thermomonospora amylolytica TaxID=1411117 RepID=UPI000E6B5412|nr:DUF397 domain-containing protein [Thermomonospora amylolytica]